MPVKIRLTRTGKKKQPSYRVVVMDSRKPRDGKYIEQIGRYDARQDPSLIEIDNERALDWLHKGAQPTERAQKLLEISGAWAQFRVDKGEIHTIADHEGAVWPEKVHVVGEEETGDQLPDAGSEEDVTGDLLPDAGSEEEDEVVSDQLPDAGSEEEAPSHELPDAGSEEDVTGDQLPDAGSEDEDVTSDQLPDAGSEAPPAEDAASTDDNGDTEPAEAEDSA